MSKLIDLLSDRSPRERMLLALMVAVLLPALVYLTLIQPLTERLNAAKQARSEAAALSLWLNDRAADLALLPAVDDASGTDAETQAIGSAALEESLKRVRLRPLLSALELESDGSIQLRFDEVRFVALMEWLSGSHPGWGYDITQMQIRAHAVQGKVSARLTLSPR
ncbi:MAG: type II secretion system protein GspM [Pseudomonadota bacterium]|jgi:type II secretory pathway component PulM|nr:type II secretion system protein GspM [Pseudomonadota bacterium]MEC8295832.1 type II secretion system protein GspM [Pseudomonadota bacterium]